MKVTFLNPCVSENVIENDGGEFSFGISILSAHLKKAGHSTSLINITSRFSREEIEERIRDADSGIFAISTFSHMMPHILRWIEVIRATRRDARVILGGVAASIMPEKMLDIEGVDAVCIGEGDEAIVEFADAVEVAADFSRIRNLWVKSPGGELVRNELRPLIADLDTLPFCDTEIFDMNNLRGMKKRIPIVPVMVSRGCHYNCNYCCNHAINHIYKGKGKIVRFMSPVRAIAEIQHMLAAITKPVTLTFVDYSFGGSVEWTEEFCRLYRAEVNKPFRAMGRVEKLNDKVLSCLQSAGCYRYTIGIESGSNRVRKDLLNRPMSNQQILTTMAKIKRHGMQVGTYNMCGFPTETREEMLETIKINALGSPDFCLCSTFWPYEQTRLYEICQKCKLLPESRGWDVKYRDVFSGSILQYDEGHNAWLSFNTKWFMVLVYVYRLFYESEAFMSRRLTRLFEELYVKGDHEALHSLIVNLELCKLEDEIYSEKEADLAEQIIKGD